MKELTIEEKAKRYDDRLEKARKWYDANTNEGYRGIFEDIFPELKESRDERIRKSLLDYLHTLPNHFSHNGGLVTDWIAWLEKHGELAFHFHQLEEYIMQLEKQCEQKSLDDIAKEVTKDKDAAVSFLKSTGIINENGELADEYKIEQDEQKSKEEVVDNLHNYLYGEQRPAWSEEDESRINTICTYLQDYARLSGSEFRTIRINEYCDWLKSLRPQTTWKPSEEQIKVCKEVYADLLSAKGFDVCTVNSELNRLEEQIKKLRNE